MNAGSEERPLIVVVTGMSGAGRSTAVHALEDLGFFCVDNVPTPVVPASSPPLPIPTTWPVRSMTGAPD